MANSKMSVPVCRDLGLSDAERPQEVGQDNPAIQLALLVTLAAIALFARTVLSPLQEAVKSGLALSDNQLALLQGPALVLPIVVLSIPLGIAIDRYKRRTVILALSSMMLTGSLLTAWSPTFPVLLGARSLVGLGTQGVWLVLLAMLADLYLPDKRGRAMMAISVAGLAGMSAAFECGGFILAAAGGWRPAITRLTAPVVMTLFLVLALKEPGHRVITDKGISIIAARQKIWAHRAVFAPLLFGGLLVGVSDGSVIIWAGPLFERAYGLSPSVMGSLIAAILLLSGFIGPLCGGLLADAAQQIAGPRMSALALGTLGAISGVSGLFAVLPTAKTAAIGLLIFLIAGSSFGIVLNSLTTIAIPNDVRGLCLAVMSAASLLFGMGLSPVIVSLVALASGSGRLDRALAIVCFVSGMVSAVIFVATIRKFPSGAAIL